MDNPAMTFDEVSMERSKSFVKALQVPYYLSLSLSLLLVPPCLHFFFFGSDQLDSVEINSYDHNNLGLVEPDP